jgi:ribose 5-phosphate isomerase B
VRIAVAFDHGGFPLRGTILKAVREAGHEPLDLGTFSPESSDYPDFAERLAKTILAGEVERGILVCGSGVGACIAANKIHGIYAGVCHDVYSAHQGVEHDAMNVLCLGARVVGVEVAKELVAAFLRAEFSSEERHLRRVEKVRQLEANGKIG